MSIMSPWRTAVEVWPKNDGEDVAPNDPDGTLWGGECFREGCRIQTRWGSSFKRNGGEATTLRERASRRLAAWKTVSAGGGAAQHGSTWQRPGVSLLGLLPTQPGTHLSLKCPISKTRLTTLTPSTLSTVMRGLGHRAGRHQTLHREQAGSRRGHYNKELVSEGAWPCPRCSQTVRPTVRGSNLARHNCRLVPPGPLTLEATPALGTTHKGSSPRGRRGGSPQGRQQTSPFQGEETTGEPVALPPHKLSRSKEGVWRQSKKGKDEKTSPLGFAFHYNQMSVYISHYVVTHWIRFLIQTHLFYVECGLHRRPQNQQLTFSL